MKKHALHTIIDFVSDFLLVSCALILLSGGALWMGDDLRELIRQKPWLHRLALSFFTGLGLLIIYVRIFLSRQTRFFWTPLMNQMTALLSLKGWIWLLFLYATVLWSVSSIFRYEVFHSSFDMAIFTQAIWNTAQGNLLFSSIKGNICLLADHFSPLLALFAVPYKFVPDPRLLLFMQAAAAAACVFPIDRLSERIFKQKGIGLAFALAFVLYLPVRNAVRFDFHPEVFAMPLLLWGFYFLLGGKTWFCSWILALALLSKENAALVTFAIGFFAFFFLKGHRLFGFLWMTGSTLYFFIVLKWVIPFFMNEEYFYLDANFIAWQREGWTALWQHFIQKSSWVYLFKIFSPLGFLSFLHFPSLILTAPMLLQNLIARNEMTRSIFFQYTVFLTPFVFISAMCGASTVKNTRATVMWLVAWTLLMSGVSEVYVIQEHAEKLEPSRQIFHQMLKQVPPTASLRTHEFLATHAAHRRHLHIYENNHPREGGSPAALNSDFVLIWDRLLGTMPESHFLQLKQSGYQSLRNEQGFHLWEKITKNG